MAIPRVFISSTCYDLKHIRESLKYFVKTVGYEPVLSEDGGVYFSVDKHTHDSCLTEVANCQFFILIIGGRYGSEHQGKDTSITNNEYKKAVEKGIPIFALVDSATLSDYFTYSENKAKRPDLAEDIYYPNSDNTKIFSFIDEVKENSKNNAIAPFNNFSDIEDYLRKQWAGMVYELLDERSRSNEADRTNSLINDLKSAVEKSEELIKNLLRSTDKEHADEMIDTVNLNAKALSFSQQIQYRFNRLVLDNTTLEDLMSIDLSTCDTWPEFLDKTEDYDMRVTEEVDPSWLSSKFPLTIIHNVYLDDGDGGAAIVGKWSNGKIEFNSVKDSALQNSYIALKQVDEDIKRKVFKALACDEVFEL